jgi:peptidoglycan/xylan/chitin deacetylase (PgdA/CDA1 family)
MTAGAPGFRIVSRVRTAESSPPLIALTYDDGPSEWTMPLLEVLRAAGAHATFFVIGEWIDGREDILVQTATDGHEIGNHTFTHPRPDLASLQDLEDEISRTSDRIASVLGEAPTLMRSPHGMAEDRVAPLAAKYGMPTTVHWSSAPGDWREPGSEVVVQRVLREAEPGGIVSLHDGKPKRASLEYPSRKNSVCATVDILASLANDGYRFVTVSELLAEETPPST